MTDRHDLDSPEGYIAFFTEVADPENKLGIARMVAAEMLADGNRVRAVLKDHPGMADRFLAAQARLLAAPEADRVEETDSVAQETASDQEET
jgi:hypothetical protein